MVKKILVAYDGSDGSKIAIKKAAEVATNFGAEVTLLTIGGPLMGAGLAGINVPQMNEQEYERVADEGIALLNECQVAAQKKVHWIDPADVILHEARIGNYDLIVMGHRGISSSIQRDAWILGSVAIKVLNRARCSVLVARPENLNQTGALDELPGLEQLPQNG
jgi:nucleotide-binding universal stress UspA family protein